MRGDHNKNGDDNEVLLIIIFQSVPQPAISREPPISQSASHYHTPTNGAHGPYTHSDLLYERNLSILWLLLAGLVALQVDSPSSVSSLRTSGRSPTSGWSSLRAPG